MLLHKKLEQLHRKKESKITVLIIEDDSFMRTVIEKAIISAKSVAKIYKFDSLEVALDQKDLAPDIIFLDHFLGNKKGVDSIPEFLRNFPYVSIAVISGQDDIQVFTDAYSKGAVAYFKKDKQLRAKIILFLQNYIPKKIEYGFFTKISDLFQGIDYFNLTKHISIIGDDMLMSFTIQYPLRNNNFLSFNNFESVELFLDSHVNFLPDLIITDSFLKGRNLDELDIIQVKEKYPNTKLLLFSSNLDVSVAERLVDSGVDYYLNKSKENLMQLKEIIEK